jgi:hypothetical protein
MTTISSNEIQKGHEGALVWTLIGAVLLTCAVYTATHFDQRGKELLTLFAMVAGVPLSIMFAWWLFKQTLILYFRVAPLLWIGFFIGVGFWLALHIL